MGKWKHWGPSMGRYFSGVQQNLNDKHTFFEPESKPSKTTTTEALRKQSSSHTDGTRTPPSATRAHHERQRVEGELELDSSDSSDDEGQDDEKAGGAKANKPVSRALNEREKELSVMRKVMRKWRRIAGLQGNAALADELGEGEFSVNWTKV